MLSFLRIGKPLDLSPWRDGPVASKELREITVALMREIQTLTGQERMQGCNGYSAIMSGVCP